MTEEPTNETEAVYEAVVNGHTDHRRLHWLIALLAGVAMAVLMTLFTLALLGEFDETDTRVDRNTETAGDACMRDNQLRVEVNRQAEAFVHHNDATLQWALVVRRVLDRTSPQGEDAFQATATLIREYRQVRDEYYTLSLLDCDDPHRSLLTPPRPVAP